jgi:hypothetical protein
MTISGTGEGVLSAYWRTKNFPQQRAAALYTLRTCFVEGKLSNKDGRAFSTSRCRGDNYAFSGPKGAAELFKSSSRLKELMECLHALY